MNSQKTSMVAVFIFYSSIWYRSLFFAQFYLVQPLTTFSAMAEAGGYNVDNYLENNFQMPEEVMALAKRTTTDDKRQASTGGGNKQTLPEVVIALCEEALNITNRHKRLAAFQAELLLKMAWYTSESAEGHLRCRWGEGPGSFSGDPGSPPRWTQTSISRLRFGDLKTKDDRDMTEINTLNRVKKVCELLQEAVSVGGLDAATRVDVAARSARLCLDGIQVSRNILIERWYESPLRVRME
jgi:hypothetical protein